MIESEGRGGEGRGGEGRGGEHASYDTGEKGGHRLCM